MIGDPQRDRVKRQYQDNALAHTMVRAMADAAEEQIDDEFILAALGSPRLLDILELGQRKLKQKLERMSVEEMRMADVPGYYL